MDIRFVHAAWRTYPKLPYHNFDHAMKTIEVAHGLADTWDPFVSRVQLDIVDLALLFHDVIYVPTAPDNEERSANFAREMHDVDGSRALGERVASLIMITTDHSRDPDDLEACLVSDADMSSLCAPPEEFEAYSRAIDAEYLPHLEAHDIDPSVYWAGRKRFLVGELALAEAGKLFFFPERLDERHTQACENLERALSGSSCA